MGGVQELPADETGAFGITWESVGWICRELGDLDQGVFVIELEGDMVADAEAMQEARVTNGECARFSRGKKNGEGQGFMIDRQDRAAKQGGLRGRRCTGRARWHATGKNENDEAQYWREHPLP